MNLNSDPGMARRDFLHLAGMLTVAAPLALSGCQPDKFAPTYAATTPLMDSPLSYFGPVFGLDEAVLNLVLKEALKNGGDYADLFFQHNYGTWLIMEDDKVNRAYTNISLGMGVRVLKGQQTGYAFSQILEKEQMLSTARAAASLAAAGGQGPGSKGVEIAAFKPQLKPDYYPMLQPWDKVSPETRLDLLRKVGHRLRKLDQRISKTLLQFHDSVSHILVATSEGVIRADLRPRTSCYASCVAEDRGKRESNYADLTTRAGLEAYTPKVLDSLADEACRRTLELFEARPVPAGEMPCVLAPGSSGILLHEAIGHGLEADFNRRRISTYSDRLGSRIASDQVTVVDDGTILHSHGAINFDDEGQDSQRTVLVEKGILKSYLQDRLSAAWYKTQSTGSGRRQSFEYAPMPRMRATFMEAGPYAPEEIIAAVKKGIYAVQFTNGQVNIGAGDFSFYVKSGYAIEDGRLTHPIKDINVIGNGPKVLAAITMVGNDLDFARSGYMCGKQGQTVPVSQGLPTTLVQSINVGGAHNG